MTDPVILNKTQSIERCLKRVEEDYFGYEKSFDQDFMRQDAIVLNLQRACEQTIDLANYLIKANHLEVPRESRNAFDTLVKSSMISQELGDKMKRMVGFRNVAIHEYLKLELEIVRSIIENNLQDFREFIWVAVPYI